MDVAEEQATTGGADGPDAWTERKYREAGYGVADDCLFEGCTDQRELPRQGKPGRPSAFCRAHNNAADKQRAYRARDKRKAEAEARAAQETAAERAPLPELLTRRTRETGVLTALLPRLLAAVDTITAAQEAAADTDTVDAHLAAVETAAAERIRDAAAERDHALLAADTARRTAEASDRAAIEAEAERQAATLETATALKEAAAADTATRAAQTALDQLAAQHQALLGRHQELTGAHDQLTDRHQALETAHTGLTAWHTDLTERAGRLEGELNALRPQHAALTERHAELEKELRTAAGDLATTTARAQELASQVEKLTARADRLDRQLADERAAHERQLTEVRAAHDEQLAEVRAEHLRALDAIRRDIADAAGRAAGPRDQDDAPEPADDDQAKPDGADDDDGEEESDTSVVALVDLGIRHGSGWTLVRYGDRGDTWSVLRDAEHVGTVEPERAITGRGSLLGWSAKHGFFTVPVLHGGRHWPSRDAAAAAVIDSAVRRTSERTAPPPPADWAVLDDDAATRLVAALIPLITARPEDGSAFGRLPEPTRAAALRTATRTPHHGDLPLLAGLDPRTLGRSRHARELHAALQSLSAAQPLPLPDPVPASDAPATGTPAGAPSEPAGTVELTELTRMLGIRCELVPDPDPDREGGHLVLADGAPVGTLTPRGSARGQRQWTAAHRRRILPSSTGGSHFPGVESGAHAILTAEQEWVPLPLLDDSAYQTMPRGPRSAALGEVQRLLGRRRRKDPLAGVGPATYKKALLAALKDFARTTTGRVRGASLNILLDAAPADFPGTAGPELYGYLQMIRAHYTAGSPVSGSEPAPDTEGTAPASAPTAQEPAPGDGTTDAAVGAPEGGAHDEHASYEDTAPARGPMYDRIEDLGEHGGSGWALACSTGHPHLWSLLRDGRLAGGVQRQAGGVGTDDSELGWSADRNPLPVRPRRGGRYFDDRGEAAHAVIRAVLRHLPQTPSARPGWWTALDEQQASAIANAAVPFATSMTAPVPVRAAALRLAVRAPHDDDLTLLAGAQAGDLGPESAELATVLAAVTCPASQPVPAPRTEQPDPDTVELGEHGGRRWTRRPDPDREESHLVFADAILIGTVTPHLRKGRATGQWTATHRRRTTAPGPGRHPSDDVAVRSVIRAEADWAPLPPLDDAAHEQIPADLRAALSGAAARIDTTAGRLAEIEPLGYREELHSALRAAARAADGIPGDRLALLLDVSREDLGPADAYAPTRLWTAIQRIRGLYASPQGAIDGRL
ncbi:hypothetical protein ACFVIM_22945 [Streptomyces sp. NPDC057638]|uniref:hypothetical protein n=1 Tax=Streptomyces sp. NPDC057638 TaxID=3346190 RepID=UPI003678547B